MSVMIIGEETFRQVYQKAQHYKYHKQVDIDYCRNLNMTEEQTKSWIIELITLNEVTYIQRYENTVNELNDKVANDYVLEKAGKNINTYQMLKYLQAIDYNTDYKAAIYPQQEEAKETLQQAIEEIKDRIIAEIPEYQNAKWNEYYKTLKQK